MFVAYLLVSVHRPYASSVRELFVGGCARVISKEKETVSKGKPLERGWKVVLDWGDKHSMVAIKSDLICYQHNFSFVITDGRKIQFLILTLFGIYILVTVLSENDPTKDSPFTSLATLKRGSSFGVSIQGTFLFTIKETSTV